MRITRRDTIFGGIALAMMPGALTAQSASVGGMAFGSTWRLVSGHTDPTPFIPLVTQRIAEIDAAMSPYRATSALSHFNCADVGQVVKIPEIMACVVTAALEAAQRTNGAFDPTTGPLVNRFGFGPITGRAGTTQDIHLRGDSLRKSAPGVTLDLCGIAKGFALDVIWNDLTAHGATDFLLELGGEIRAHGAHPSGRSWQIAVENPLSRALTAQCIVAPGASALATSGHSANGLLGDITVSHVIDPQNARPATGFAASVSVLAPSGMEADVLATALLAMGENGPDFARQSNISALFVTGPPSGGTNIMTGDFAAHVVA